MKPQPTEIMGRRYPSIRAACRAHGIANPWLYAIKVRCGFTTRRALAFAVARRAICDRWLPAKRNKISGAN